MVKVIKMRIFLIRDHNATTHDHTMTPCHYLPMMTETSTDRAPTCVLMIVNDRRNGGAVKWSPAHAEAIETGNGGRWGVTASKLSNVRILYFPQSLTHPPSPAVKHTRTHKCTQAHQACPLLYPLEVRVWYQPICSNHPRNPDALTSTSPYPRSSFLFPYPACATAERQPHQTHALKPSTGAAHRKEGQPGGLSEPWWERQQKWSPALALLGLIRLFEKN